MLVAGLASLVLANPACTGEDPGSMPALSVDALRTSAVITVTPPDGFSEDKVVVSNGGANSPNAIYRTLEGEAVPLVPAFVTLAGELAGEVSWNVLTCGQSGTTAIRGVEEIDGIWASVSLSISSADATMHLRVGSPEVRGGLDARPPVNHELEVDPSCPEDVAALRASGP